MDKIMRLYRNLLIFFLLVGIVIFTVSFYIQYGMSIPPCIYCQLQRWGYFLMIPLGIAGLVSRYKKFVLRLIELTLLGIFLVAVIHTFKEFFGDACSCQVGAKKWEIFGVTASLYSALFSLILLILNHMNIKKGFSRD